jgi:hypothetical protein
MRLALLLSLLIVPVIRAGEKSGLNVDGFVQKWLILAPFPLGTTESGAGGLEREVVKDEAKLKPKAKDTIKVDNKEYTWKEHTHKEFLLDFNMFLGSEHKESIGYAVVYLHAPAEMKVKMKTGSDDQCKVWLNGAEAVKVERERIPVKDDDSTDVTLKKGVNVVVVKVVNVTVGWGFCMRFVEKDGKAVTNLEAKTAE